MQKMQAAAGGKPLGPNGQPSPAQIQAMRKAMPPDMLRKLQAAGPGGAQKMMQEMMGGGGAPGGMDIGAMMKGMMGGGGMPGMGGGMPDMSQMQGSFLDPGLAWLTFAAEAMKSMGMGGAGGGGMPGEFEISDRMA